MYLLYPEPPFGFTEVMWICTDKYVKVTNGPTNICDWYILFNKKFSIVCPCSFCHTVHVIQYDSAGVWMFVNDTLVPILSFIGAQ
jgi:hypothetical protein